jgi:ribonuclease HII
MDTIERNYWDRKIRFIAGVDEVGRGPLAGPVVAAAVIFAPGSAVPEGVDDSKKIPEPVRETVFDRIHETALSIGIGIVDHHEIDTINILQATFKAMKFAVSTLKQSPHHIIVDGNMTPDFAFPSTAIVKGDSISFSIAAASVIAKVTRDRIMRELDRHYPQYGFRSNKGYASRHHRNAIKEYGLSPEHRVTFCRNILNEQLPMWNK